MNLTAFVDVAIGLTLVFLGASLFVTIINEFIAQALNRRGKQLVESLNTLFDSEPVRSMVKSAPLLDKLLDGKTRRSYVDTLDLAQALIAGLGSNTTGTTTMTARSWSRFVGSRTRRSRSRCSAWPLPRTGISRRLSRVSPPGSNARSPL